MKIFTTSQVRTLDAYTIQHEPILSIDLMERAAERMFMQFQEDWDKTYHVLILCGAGNNGGDGLALGRMLLQVGYEVKILLLHKGKLSADCEINRNRLREQFPNFLEEQENQFIEPKILEKTLIVDALFGSGLSRPIEGFFTDAVKWINCHSNQVLSIDIPSGLQGEKCVTKEEAVVYADMVYTLQFPKLSFLFSENEQNVPNWKIIDIGLHPEAIRETPTNYFFLEEKDIAKKLKKRVRFSHKGTYGHALIWAGSKGMAGAAVLATKSALRSGAGLVSVLSAEENRLILQTSVPEAIFVPKPKVCDKYNAFAFGPGLGKEPETKEQLETMLKVTAKSLVLDADALNLIAENRYLFDLLPKNTILTPHPKEFERLFGATANTEERLKLAVEKAKELNVIIVLKGAYTCVASPNGQLYFNSTGNSGMAVGGMGDALTGIIVGLLAQGYSEKDSAILGVYLHGLAGDLALEIQSEESLLPTDLINNIGKAYRCLRR